MVLGTLFIWHGLGAAASLVMGQHLRAWLEGYQPTFFVFGAVMGVCAVLSVVLGFLPKPDKVFGKQAAAT
jgi:hypothetical protein